MKDDNYEEIVAHGYRILRDMMWDSEDGRPHTLLSIDGDSLEVLSTGKSVYAIHSLIGMIAMLKGGFILSKMHIDS